MNKLTEAKLKVMEEVKYVEKTGKGTTGSRTYSYATEGDILNSLRSSMIKHGITLTCDKIVPLHVEPGHFIGCYTYLFSCGLDTESHCVIAEGKGSTDKAGYIANTGASKYVLRGYFMLELGDDPDLNMFPELSDSPSVKKAKSAINAANTTEKLTEVRLNVEMSSSNIPEDIRRSMLREIDDKMARRFNEK